MSANASKETSSEIVIFGEVLFDCFPDGSRVLGGAPFNVAWSLNGFGHHPVFVSSVGTDTMGGQIEDKMRAWGMSTHALQRDPQHKTGEVRVTISDDEPSYTICEDRAWDFIDDAGHVSTGLVYHGLLALRNRHSEKALEAIVQRSNALRFFDINLRFPYVDQSVLVKWLHKTDWLKLNIDELNFVTGRKDISFEHSDEAIEQLKDKYSVGNVLLTGGSEGAILSGEYGSSRYIPAPKPKSIVDTVGAGDAFSASVIDGILSGQSASRIVRESSWFAAKVCAMRGATTQNNLFYKKTYA